MEEVFTATAVVDLLSTLPKRSAKVQIQCWNTQKEQRRRTSTLLYSLGRQITAAQAKRLDTLSLSYEVLCELRRSCSTEDFMRRLSQRGVRSRKLREKLSSVLDSRAKHPAKRPWINLSRRTGSSTRSTKRSTVTSARGHLG